MKMNPTRLWVLATLAVLASSLLLPPLAGRPPKHHPTRIQAANVVTHVEFPAFPIPATNSPVKP